MTTINNVGINDVSNVNFQGTDSAKKTDNKPSDDKKMKTSTKLMIGATALATAVIAGLAIKKGLNTQKANTSLKKFCEAFGIKDLDAKTFKECRTHFKEVSGYKELTYKEINRKALSIQEKGDLPEDATFNIIRGKELRDLFSKLTGRKDAKLPDNAMYLSITGNNNKNVYYSELAFPKTVDKDLQNLLGTDEIIRIK